jgi:hypothetical protein
LACLYVSSKLHDTLKKPREIILASYPLRYPHLLQHRKGGALDPAAVDQAALEGERGRVLSIERLVLESVCFRFGTGGGLGWVVKLSKRLGRESCCQHRLICPASSGQTWPPRSNADEAVSKEMSMQAWRTAIDW